MEAKRQIHHGYYFEGVYHYLISSFIITQLLFFMDERAYSFKWMIDEPLTWFIFGVYFLSIFTSQVILSDGLFRKFKGNLKVYGCMLLGTFIGVGALYLLYLMLSR